MISRKTDYALRCLVYLVRQKEPRLVSTAELSQKLKVPRVFLSKIFQQLAAEKIVETVKGKGGGIRLKAKNINLLTLIQKLEPDFCLNRCLDGHFKCSFAKVCPLHKVLGGLQQQLNAGLRKVTLEQLSK